jgi:acetylornithine deacetylase
VLINQLKAGDVSLPFFADRVPGRAWLTLWAESYPGMTQDDVIGDLQAIYRQAQTCNEVLAAFEPQWTPIRWLDGSQVAAKHPGVTMLTDIIGAVRGQPAVVQGAPFACDGHMFNLYSPTPMVLLGPTGGQPHSPDEFVFVEDYLPLVEIFIRAAMAWCGTTEREGS